eukprot:9891850-Alexandrium_andersonii.AAC.1
MLAFARVHQRAQGGEKNTNCGSPGDWKQAWVARVGACILLNRLGMEGARVDGADLVGMRHHSR